MPQGCVCSPLLFTVYINKYRSYHPEKILKFSDDTAILGLLYKDEDIQHCTTEIANFVAWSNENSLVINVRKTEEIIFDLKLVGIHSPIMIKNEPIRQVASYKSLGLLIDNKPSWEMHDNMC